MKKYKRRKILIDRPFQLKYMALLISLLLFHTLTVLAAVFGPTVYDLYSATTLEQKTEAARSILLFHKTMWPWIFAIIATFGVLSIFVTHKMAGPLFRIITDLRSIESGDYSIRITLRKGDELIELAEQINSISDKFNVSRNILIQKQELIARTLDEMKSEINAAVTDKSAALLLAGKIETELSGISALITPEKKTSTG